MLGSYYQDKDGVRRLNYNNMKANFKYLLSTTLTCGLCSMNLGFAISAQWYTIPALKQHYKLDYIKYLETISLVGAALGALYGGHIIKYGRRNAIIYYSIWGIIGSGISVVNEFYTICLGRLIYGFSSSILIVTASKYLEETIP